MATTRCRNAADGGGIADLARKMSSQQLAKNLETPSARLRKPMKTNLIGYKCHVITSWTSCLGFEDPIRAVERGYTAE